MRNLDNKIKEVLYSRSHVLLVDKLNSRIRNGYSLVGEIKMGSDGKWACLVEKVIEIK